jgi:predicted metalloprotease
VVVGYVGTGPLGQERQIGFVNRELGDTEDVWPRLFAERGKPHQVPVLVLISESVDSASGIATSATGRFYYPEDSEVDIDLWFFCILTDKYGAAGDFSRACVIAHEIGHQVENLTGVL